MSKKAKLIVVGIVVLLVGSVAAHLYTKYGYANDKAEGELADYLKNMYGDRTVLGTECTSLDTDGDGYISCDARTLLKNGAEEKVTVECAATFFNSGCKTKQLLPGLIAPSARYGRAMSVLVTIGILACWFACGGIIADVIWQNITGK